MSIDTVLNKRKLSSEDLCSYLLGTQGTEKTRLFEHSAKIKEQHVGNRVYFRGLIEFSNICAKNCLYCGIRHDNPFVNRYQLTDEEICDAARFAFENNYGSLVLQSGESETVAFTKRIEKLLSEIHKITDGRLRITLSCGEQAKDTYRRWFDSGAHRYLLRIEASDQELYEKLHPFDGRHMLQTPAGLSVRLAENRFSGWYGRNDRIAVPDTAESGQRPDVHEGI